jgi:hypothetical protein
MAGSLTLLLVTGYIVFGMERTMVRATGFDARNVQLISVDPIRDGYSVSQTEDFYLKLLDHVKALPGVVSATWTEAIPMQPSGRITFTTRQSTLWDTTIFRPWEFASFADAVS